MLDNRFGTSSSTSSDSITFNSVDPSSLSHRDLGEIFQIEQDMWGREEGLGEYLKCSSCSIVYSKQDIYGHLSKGEYQLTVSELEQRETRDIFCCQNCGSTLLHSFGKDEYMKAIQDRYAGRATLLLMEKGDKIIGFMDGYVDSFEAIYDKEFSDHYGDLGIEVVREMVMKSLGGIMPEEFFSCSSSGTRERYMNFIHIYNLLRYFYENFPQDMEEVTALSELHAGGPYTRIFSALGARSIGVRDQYGEKIHATDTYKSDIYAHERYGEKCKAAFSGKQRREFLDSIK